MNDTSSGWKRGVLVGLGVIAIILSILVFIDPGMTVVTIVYIMGITLIIIGIEKIIRGIFVRRGFKVGNSRSWIIVLYIFGSIALGFPVKYQCLCNSYVGHWSTICRNLSYSIWV